MTHARAGTKLWGIAMITMVLTVVISIYASVRISEQSIRTSIANDAAAREERRVATCDLVNHVLAAYEEAPPSTATGDKVREAWVREYRILNCTPRK